MTFDFEEFQGDRERRKEFLRTLYLLLRFIVEFFMFKRSNLYGEQVVLLITN